MVHIWLSHPNKNNQTYIKKNENIEIFNILNKKHTNIPQEKYGYNFSRYAIGQSKNIQTYYNKNVNIKNFPNKKHTNIPQEKYG